MEVSKVFISHASEDKSDFAIPLATKLREDGVDAWVDKWELVPGDSLVDKVFEQGLGNSSTVVFLMSKNSLNKDKHWVRAELENAVHRHIEGELRLIPVLLEECDVPQSVRSILRIDLAKEGSIEAVADRVTKTVYGQSDKPPLGSPPSYANASDLRVEGLDTIDELVLGIVFEASLVHDRRLIQGGHLLPFAEKHNLSWDELKESTAFLCETGWLYDKDETAMGRHIVVEIPAATVLDIAASLGMPVAELQKQIAGAILNDGIQSVGQLQEIAQCPKGLTNAILDVFEGNGFIRLARVLGGPGSVHSPSVTFKRWLRDA